MDALFPDSINALSKSEKFKTNYREPVIMKNLVVNLTYLCLVIGLLSCGDDDNHPIPTAAIKIINATVEAGLIMPKNFDFNISNRAGTAIPFGGSERFTLPANTPTDLLLVKADDTLTTVLNETVNFEEGTIYSFFAAGRFPNVESVLIRDEFINYQDSTFGVRFVNMSPDSEALSVRISDTMANVVTDLGYKGASTFSPLPATGQGGTYTFEFVNENDEVLAATSFDPISERAVFQNVTLALVGLADDGTGGNSLFVTTIDHFSR